MPTTSLPRLVQLLQNVCNNFGHCRSICFLHKFFHVGMVHSNKQAYINIYISSAQLLSIVDKLVVTSDKVMLHSPGFPSFFSRTAQPYIFHMSEREIGPDPSFKSLWL